jgi:hypothetical protein
MSQIIIYLDLGKYDSPRRTRSFVFIRNPDNQRYLRLHFHRFFSYDFGYRSLPTTGINLQRVDVDKPVLTSKIVYIPNKGLRPCGKSTKTTHNHEISYNYARYLFA